MCRLIDLPRYEVFGDLTLLVSDITCADATFFFLEDVPNSIISRIR
jgi:hypothetical protein